MLPSRPFDDGRRRSRRLPRPLPTWALVLIVVGVSGWALYAVVMGLLLAWAETPPGDEGWTASGGDQVPDRPVFARPDFEAAVRGKARAEVAVAVGRPDEVRDEVKVVWWVYRGRVTDEATGKPYAEARVAFGRAGKADRFEYR